MDDFDQIDEEEVEEGSAPWMATFADLMSLLLTFFVLLLSFAQMDIVKFRDAMGSINEAFGSKNIIGYTYVTKDTFMPQVMDELSQGRQQKVQKVKVKVKENEEILRRINETIDKNNLESLVKAKRTGRGVVISVKGQLFFKSGSDILKTEAYPLLDDILGIVEEFPYKMSVEGHTDDSPIHTARFPSNWELSTARAISALKYFLDSGRIDSDRLGASGYADTRPIASNDTLEGRKQNRRVEFIFFKE